MIKSVEFVDSKYSRLTVAGRAIREYAIENIKVDEIISGEAGAHLHVIIRTDIIGLYSEDIIEMIAAIRQFPACILFDRSACIIVSDKPFMNWSGTIESFLEIADGSFTYDSQNEEATVIQDMRAIADFSIDIHEELSENAMIDGVHFVDVDNVVLSYDTKYGEGVVIESSVYIGPGVKLGDNVTIKAFSYIEGANIKAGSTIGPFARIRGKTEIGENAKIGNFVEVKNSKLEEGTKAGHLSYIGDAEIGKRVNIGAGVVTCNYDGKDKHKTQIGDDAFIGTNSSLIAPLKIGKDCLIGAGSFINRDVPDNSFAHGRSKQQVRDKK